MAQYIYGKNVVLSRLKEKQDVEVLYLLEGSDQKKELIPFLTKDLVVEIASKSKLERLVRNSYHQGYVAKIKEYPYFSLDEVLTLIKDKEQPLFLILDGVNDPHNMGAIIRTCDAVGVDGLIVDKIGACPLNSTVAKTSTGAIETVKVIQVSNLTQTIKKLKKIGYWVVGAEANQSQDYRTVDYNTPLVIVMGSEGKGISRLVLENCDFKVRIPLLGSVNSLNVSVATAIILYEVNNKRFPV